MTALKALLGMALGSKRCHVCLARKSDPDQLREHVKHCERKAIVTELRMRGIG